MIRRDSGIEEVEADFGTLLKAKTRVKNFQNKTTRNQSVLNHF